MDMGAVYLRAPASVPDDIRAGRCKAELLQKEVHAAGVRKRLVCVRMPNIHT